MLNISWEGGYKAALYIFIIIIVGLVAYSNTFHSPFYFDDFRSIVRNPAVKGLDSPIESGNDGNEESSNLTLSMPRYIGILSFAINYYLHGIQVKGYHIFNLTIHIINAILVYWLVVLTFRTPFIKAHSSLLMAHSNNEPSTSYELRTTNYIAFFSALLFVSHPIQTQAVTYIVQRFTSLATMFYLLSLVSYIKFRIHDTGYRIQPPFPLNKGGIKGGCPPLLRGELKGGGLHAIRYTLYAISILSAILAMKTKEIAFTLPFIITLYEFMFFGNNQFVIPVKTGIQDKNEMDSCFRRNDRMESGYKRILYLIPFLLTLLVIPLSLIGIDRPIGDAIGELREAAHDTEEISRWSYLLTQFRVIVTYIRLLLLPINQNLDYDYPIFHSFFNPEVFLSFLFLLSIFGLGVYLLYCSRYTTLSLQNSRSEPQTPSISTRYTLYASRFLAFGISWFFITLSVESSIIPIRDVINEHRLYLPSVGAAIAFTTVVFYFVPRLLSLVSRFSSPNSELKTPSLSLSTAYFLLSTIIIVLSIATYQRNTVWKNEVSLWDDVVSKSPLNARGHNNLGKAYSEKGLVDRAIGHYQAALRLRPDIVETYYNLGKAYSEKGLVEMAIEQYRIVIKLKPAYAEAYNVLGYAYTKKGLIDMAIEQYQTAIKWKPDYAEVYNNLGTIYYDKGLIDRAIQQYQTAIRFKPNYAVAYSNLGLAYTKKGWLNKAIEAYRAALKYMPDYSKVHYNLAVIYLSSNNHEAAMHHYRILKGLDRGLADSLKGMLSHENGFEGSRGQGVK